MQRGFTTRDAADASARVTRRRHFRRVAPRYAGEFRAAATTHEPPDPRTRLPVNRAEPNCGTSGQASRRRRRIRRRLQATGARRDRSLPTSYRAISSPKTKREDSASGRRRRQRGATPSSPAIQNPYVVQATTAAPRIKARVMSRIPPLVPRGRPLSPLHFRESSATHLAPCNRSRIRNALRRAHSRPQRFRFRQSVLVLIPSLAAASSNVGDSASARRTC